MACWCEGKCPHIAMPMQAAKNNRIPRASMLLRGALLAAPYCPEVNLMLADILARGNLGLEAEVHIERAAIYGDPGRVAFQRASVLRQQMKLEAAAPAYLAAMDASPENPNVFAAAIGAAEMAGDVKGAAIMADAARAKFPESAEVRRAAATVAAAAGDYQTAAVMLEDIGGPELMAIEYLDRGRYFEKLGQHGRAWADWMTGKTITREKLGHRYRGDFFAKQFTALAEAASPTRAPFMRTADPAPGPQPIFVCGFPRSGTTLTETMLSNHSAIAAGDELMGVNNVIEALPAWCKVRAPYPAALLATSLGENIDIPNLLRDLYLAGARRKIGWDRMRRPPKFFTDKMPLNEIHLPLIRLLFPNAIIFRLQRHPLDVMVSCMSQWLAHGGFFASSLEDCARHFLAVDTLLWNYNKFEVTPDHRNLWHRVNYETLVQAPGHCMADMLHICGLKFEASTIKPHKNPRHARTLSYAQVKKPIGQGSVGRWKNFREQLAPAVEILRPIMERDGDEF